MAGNEDWVDIGAADELSRLSVQRVLARRLPLAISFKD
jgi:hypothetical protein